MTQHHKQSVIASHSSPRVLLDVTHSVFNLPLGNVQAEVNEVFLIMSFLVDQIEVSESVVCCQAGHGYKCFYSYTTTKAEIQSSVGADSTAKCTQYQLNKDC